MHNHPSACQAHGRYLTPFCSIALGLALILVLTGCDRKKAVTVETATVTQSAIQDQAHSPVQFGTQAHTKKTPTPLPPIPATPDERTPSPLGVMANELSGLQVSLWYPWAGSTGASFQAILDAFNRTNKWGITVTATGYNGFGALDDAMETGLSAGLLPDVLMDYSYQARHWDNNGVLTDLTPYVSDTVWGLTSDEQADFYPGFWAEDLVTSGSKPKSRRLGIPYYRSAYVLFYNQSWAEELGYPKAPITPEDFRVRACAAAESLAKRGDKSKIGKGGWLITPDPGMLSGWIYAFGGDIINPNTDGYLFDTVQTRQAFDYLKGLQKSGCAWADAALDAQTELANRQALFVVGSLYDIPSQQTAFTQAGSLDDWIVIPFPSNIQPVVDTYGPSLLVTHSTSEKQLASWLVVEWLVYPPNQAEFVSQLETLPTRLSTLSYFDQAGSVSPQWAQSLAFLADARAEPTLSSWEVMRWALSDASSQLFSLQFDSAEIPTLISKLDMLAEETLRQVH